MAVSPDYSFLDAIYWVNLEPEFPMAIDWIDRWDMPFGPVSEHPGEHIHSRWLKFIANKQVASPNHENFGDNLKTLGIAWNSQAAIGFD